MVTYSTATLKLSSTAILLLFVPDKTSGFHVFILSHRKNFMWILALTHEICSALNYTRRYLLNSLLDDLFIYMWACPSVSSLRSTAAWARGDGHAAQRPQWTTAFPEPSSGPVEPLQVLQHRAEVQQARRAVQTGQHSTGTRTLRAHGLVGNIIID